MHHLGDALDVFFCVFVGVFSNVFVGACVALRRVLMSSQHWDVVTELVTVLGLGLGLGVTWPFSWDLDLELSFKLDLAWMWEMALQLDL